ncbi:tetratricopeptide repeat protein [Nocardia sp. NPDC051832]|uniref:tetratricopeptide repeat protein n=1 Tax=Nocardia sp. NPDC051832 TaxID=3155673 RepID=UPI003414EE44
MGQDSESTESLAARENEWVRAVLLKPDHPMRDDALDVAEDARAMAMNALGEHHPAYAEATQNLGIYYCVHANDIATAADYFDQARQIVGPYHPILARGFYFLGLHYRDVGNKDNAREFFTEVLNIIRREGHPEDPRIDQVTQLLTSLEAN